jgi:hypothetical protein
MSTDDRTPKLPEPAGRFFHYPCASACDAFTADQMREHAAACVRAALEAAVPRWRPIEEAPMDGYMLVHEDEAIRALLRIDGVWHKPGYPAIIAHPWGDALVGDDAKRILPPGYRLEHRDGCCDNPTHWMPIPAAPAPGGEGETNG